MPQHRDRETIINTLLAQGGTNEELASEALSYYLHLSGTQRLLRDLASRGHSLPPMSDISRPALVAWMGWELDVTQIPQLLVPTRSLAISLSPREIQLMAKLILNQGAPVPRGELLDFADQNPDGYISPLRKKLGRENRNLLVTVRDVGFKLAPAVTPSSSRSS